MSPIIEYSEFIKTHLDEHKCKSLRNVTEGDSLVLIKTDRVTAKLHVTGMRLSSSNLYKMCSKLVAEKMGESVQRQHTAKERGWRTNRNFRKAENKIMTSILLLLIVSFQHR